MLADETPSYGNKDRFINTPKDEISKGSSANTSFWEFTCNHIGTHIDLPFHFDEDGEKYEDYCANDFIFNDVSILDIPCDKGVLINNDSFQWDQLDPKTTLLLVRIGYEKFRNTDKYWNDNPGLDPTLCTYLKSKFNLLKCIGFDFISLTSANFKTEGRLSHSLLLSSSAENEPILILEDMSLANVNSLISKVIIAPL